MVAYKVKLFPGGSEINPDKQIFVNIRGEYQIKTFEEAGLVKFASSGAVTVDTTDHRNKMAIYGYKLSYKSEFGGDVYEIGVPRAWAPSN